MGYWDVIINEIFKITKVITYERARHEKSEMGREPRHGLNITKRSEGFGNEVQMKDVTIIKDLKPDELKRGGYSFER